MKIETSPRLLVIDNRPWIIGIVLTGALLGMAAWGVFALSKGEWGEAAIAAAAIPFLLVFIWAFVRRNQLILNATDGTATLRERRLRRYKEVVFDLPHLDRAEVETSHTSKGTATHRMTLVFTGGMNVGNHPFTDAYVSGGSAKRATRAVNDWLAAWRGAS